MIDAAVTLRRIPTAYLIRINTFYQTDGDIHLCKSKRDTETFRYEWFAGWFKEEVELLRLPALNAPRVKEALRKFLLEAEDMLQCFQFLGYYFVRDMDGWLAAVTGEDEEGESQTDEQLHENIANNLPFGLIPLGNCESESYGTYYLAENRLTMSRAILYECNDNALAARYAFQVLDMGARFVPISSPNAARWAARFLRQAPSGAATDVLAVSPFMDLLEQRDLLDEAEVAQMDANSMRTYPEPYMVANPLPDARIEDVAEDTLYAVDSLLGARQVEGLQRQELSMNIAQCQLQRIQMRDSMYRPERQTSVTAQRKLFYNRPYLRDTMQYVPKSVTMPNIPQPAPLVNVEHMRSRYENDICAVMALPYSFFKPYGTSHGSGSGSGNGASQAAAVGTTRQQSPAQLEHAQRLMDDEVKRKHTLYDRLFKEIYRYTFRELDQRLFGGSTAYALVEPGVRFLHTVAKSDEAIHNLLQYYDAGIIDAVEIRRLLYKSYGIEKEPELEPRKRRLEEGEAKKKKKKKKKKAEGGEEGEEEPKKKKKKTEGGEKESGEKEPKKKESGEKEPEKKKKKEGGKEESKEKKKG